MHILHDQGTLLNTYLHIVLRLLSSNSYARVSRFIYLKENNAVALIDVCKEEVLDIFGLGFKDHSLPKNKLDASDKDSGKFYFQFCSDLMLLHGN